MSVHIEFDKDYSKVSMYTGKINDKYEFKVKVYWDSIRKKYIPTIVEFSDDLSMDFDTFKVNEELKRIAKEKKND